MCGGARWAAVHGVAKSRTRLSDFTFTFHFHALEKAMATHCSVLAWRIPGMGEPGGLPSLESHRVGTDWSDLAAAAETETTRSCTMAGATHFHPRLPSTWHITCIQQILAEWITAYKTSPLWCPSAWASAESSTQPPLPLPHTSTPLSRPARTPDEISGSITTTQRCGLNHPKRRHPASPETTLSEILRGKGWECRSLWANETNQPLVSLTSRPCFPDSAFYGNHAACPLPFPAPSPRQAPESIHWAWKISSGRNSCAESIRTQGTLISKGGGWTHFLFWDGTSQHIRFFSQSLKCQSTTEQKEGVITAPPRLLPCPRVLWERDQGTSQASRLL